MYLETERMVLRDFAEDDLNDLHEIFSDPEVMKFIEPPYDIKQTEDFLKSFCIERDPKGAYAAVLKESNKVIGYVLFKPVDENEIYEAGWIFNKKYWGKGYASEICGKLIQHGFEDMGLHKICAEAIDEAKSVPLMKKLGMQLEGVQRKHAKDSDGKWADLFWCAILADDYFAAD
jgi:RimJ/RimL family protein N-acetyltransferase